MAPERVRDRAGENNTRRKRKCSQTDALTLPSKDISSAPSPGVAYPTPPHFRENCADAESIEFLNGLFRESTDAVPVGMVPDVDAADATLETMGCLGMGLPAAIPVVIETSQRLHSSPETKNDLLMIFRQLPHSLDGRR